MSRQRVMILGITGALGDRLATSLVPRFELVSPRPRRPLTACESFGQVEWIDAPFDALQPSALDELLRQSQPDAIVNCVAITPGHPQAADATVCLAVNGSFPHALAASAQRCDARVIHISTDAVFSGSRGGYSETDTPDPIDVYGRTKLIGEINYPGCVTLRTTFFGLSSTGNTLLDWFLRQRSKSVNAYANYRFSGVWVGTLAAVITQLLGRTDTTPGVYHVGGEEISKLQLLDSINTRLGLGINLRIASKPCCDRSLDSSRLWSHLGMHYPSFETTLEAMLPELRGALSTAKNRPISNVA